MTILDWLCGQVVEIFSDTHLHIPASVIAALHRTSFSRQRLQHNVEPLVVLLCIERVVIRSLALDNG
jgi:hypothetical protein